MTIEINKTITTSGTSSVLCVGNDEWKTAYKSLTETAFAVYLLLSSNTDGDTITFTPALLEKELGLKKTTFYDRFKELEDKGYLVSIVGKKKSYIFFTTPVA